MASSPPADAVSVLLAETKQKSLAPPSAPLAAGVAASGKGKTKRKRQRLPLKKLDNQESNQEKDEDEDDEEEEDIAATTTTPGAEGVKGSKASARAPRRSAAKAAMEFEMKLLKKDMEFTQHQLQTRDAQVARLEKEVAELKKQLQDERNENKRFLLQAHGQESTKNADAMYHLAKSHHSAMNTIQTSQQTQAQVLASAFGQSILRLKDKGNRMKELMPPLPDLKQPNSRQIYHEQVAAYLKKKVTKLDEGQELLKKIDAAIVDTQQTIEDERKRISPDLSTQQLSDLQHTLEEEQTRISALKYERDMLALGLAKHQSDLNKGNQSAPVDNGSAHPKK